MKNYSILSKIILIICLGVIMLAILNSFTGIINTTIQASGTVICIMSCILAGNSVITLECEKRKKK